VSKPVLLDASAMLAYMLAETGADVVEQHLPHAAMSTINAAEVMVRLVDRGMPLESALSMIVKTSVRIVDYTLEDAATAASLRSTTKKLGLSAADRGCMATAIRLQSDILTADKAWATLNLPIRVHLLR
jgi:ribonuclease VapC